MDVGGVGSVTRQSIGPLSFRLFGVASHTLAVDSDDAPVRPHLTQSDSRGLYFWYSPLFL